MTFTKLPDLPMVSTKDQYWIEANGQRIGKLWRQGPGGRFQWAFRFDRKVGERTYHTERIDCHTRKHAMLLATALWEASPL